MRTLNIKVSNTQYHTKPIYDLYKHSLDNNSDSNIEDIIVKTIHIKLELLKQGVSIT